MLMKNSYNRHILKLLVIFTVIFYGTCIYLRVSESRDRESSKLVRKLNYLEEQTEILEKKIFDLTVEKDEALRKLASCNLESQALREKVPMPTLQYEQNRRRIRQTMNFIWDYTKGELDYMISLSTDYKEQLLNIRKWIYDHRLSFLNDWNQMSLNDGYEEFRRGEEKNLEAEVQKWFYDVQHPTNCSTARFLKCTGEKGCGWSCELARYAECFVVAVATNRITVFEKNKNYDVDEYKTFYQPIHGCSEEAANITEAAVWPACDSSRAVEIKGFIPYARPHIEYLFKSVPAHLADRLTLLYTDPAVWWMGQIFKYLMRPTSELTNLIDTSITKYHFRHPIVGVHVRRTDKILEAAYQPLRKYMEVADEYYDLMELNETVEKRRIWLATDEPSVITEAIEKYPNYEILSMNVTTAPTSVERFKFSATGIITDALLLQRCDFFIGTFSSNVGRRIFEFMHYQYHDAPFRAKSLDTRHFEWSEQEYFMRFRIPHTVYNVMGKQIKFLVNETVKLMDQFESNAVVKVKKLDNSIDYDHILVPAYKLEVIVKTIDFLSGRH